MFNIKQFAGEFGLLLCAVLIGIILGVACGFVIPQLGATLGSLLLPAIAPIIGWIGAWLACNIAGRFTMATSIYILGNRRQRQQICLIIRKRAPRRITQLSELRSFAAILSIICSVVSVGIMTVGLLHGCWPI